MAWNRTANSIALQLETRVHELQKKQARAVLKNLHNLSPIKSGRYRSNHIVSIGRPSTTFDARRRDYNRWYGVALEQINNSPRGAKIFIQNNLPYALKIEDGSSTQAPTGVYRIAKMSIKL
jgi:hypothetical protein